MNGRTWFATFCLLFVLWGGGNGAASAAQAPERGPQLDAKAWIVIDGRTGQALGGRRVTQHLPMASTTKLMTAYLAVRNLRFRQRVRAVNYRGDPAESLMGLEPGQVVSVRDLVYGLMMLSGNDAAATLAKAVSGNQASFVRLMNRTARELGLMDTSYENPIGLDGPSHYTSASDLAKLSRVVMDMPRLRQISGARVAKLTSYRPARVIETTDSFLRENVWATGIKTGRTLSSGFTLASAGRKKATELIGAVIGAPTEAARNGETVRLLDWGFSLYTKKVPIKVGRPVATVPVRYESEDLAVTSRRRFRIGVRQGEQLTVVTDLPGEVEGPIRSGQRLGSATVRLDGAPLGTVPLFAGRAVEEPSMFDRLLGSPLALIGLLTVAVCAILSLVLLLRRRKEANARKRLQRVLRTRR